MTDASTSTSSTPTTTTTRRPTPSPATSTRAWPSGRCSGPRSTASSGCSSAAASTGSSPTRTFDPVARPGCLDDYFRGRSPGRRHPRRLRRARADPPRVPRTATPASRCIDEQGIERLLPVPDARRRHGGGAAATTPTPPTPRSARSTAGSTTTGACTTRTASSARPYITLLDPDQARRRARLGARARRPRGRHAGRPGHGARPAAARPATRSTTRSGRGSTRPASPSPTTRARPATAATWSTGASRPSSRRSAARRSTASLTSDRAISDTMAALDLPRPVRALPEPARRHHRERLGVGPPAGQEAEEGVLA